MAYGIVELGLNEQQFWKLTPAKLMALIDQKSEAYKRQDYRFGVLTLIIRGIVGAKRADVWDYFPQHKDKSRKEPIAQTLKSNLKAFIEGQKAHGTEEKKRS